MDSKAKLQVKEGGSGIQTETQDTNELSHEENHENFVIPRKSYKLIKTVNKRQLEGKSNYKFKKKKLRKIGQSVKFNSSMQEDPPNQEMAIGEEVPSNQEVSLNRENEASQEETTNNNDMSDDPHTDHIENDDPLDGDLKIGFKLHPVEGYEIELRKKKAIIPVDPNLLKFVIPEYDEKRCSLKRNKYLVLGRKCFVDEEEEHLEDSFNIKWIYFCSCNPIHSDFVQSLAVDAKIEESSIAESCLHIRAVCSIVRELDHWNDSNNPLEYQDQSLEDETVEPIDEKMLVLLKGSVGVVSYDGLKLWCGVCQVSFCRHCAHLKMKKQKGGAQLFFSKTYSAHKRYKRLAVSSQKIPFIPSSDMEKQLASLDSLKKEDLIVCEDDTQCCIHVTKIVDNVKLITKTCVYNSKVISKSCDLCNRFERYDGLSQGVLNMGDFLVHHSLLRDYMLHFLYGQSCTLNSYFEILIATHESCGNKNLSDHFSYEKFKSSWYSFLNLLEFSCEEGSTCPSCGTYPEIVVCDATSLGYQRKFAAKLLETTISKNKPFKKFSEHNDRLAIPKKKTRNEFKKWISRQLPKKAEYDFLNVLRSDHRWIYEVIKMVKERFPSSIPDAIVDLFLCFCSDSAVCSYIPAFHDELVFELMKPGIKSNLEILKRVQMELPLFFPILTAFSIENCLPEEWKGLLLELCNLAKKPFAKARSLNTPIVNEEEGSNDLASFPNLPLLRSRGYYHQDMVSSTREKDCRKNYSGHPNLMSGIFTIYCPHGICFGFQVMEREESPNVPFTLFRTRFPIAPKVIIYDNCCHLHNYCLNRDPWFFKETKFLIDRFHWKNHTACSLGYCMKNQPAYNHINSEINEQQNASTKKLKKQLSYMTPENFMNHCRFFIWHRNYLKKKNNILQ